MPFQICDVTVAVRFATEPESGLHLQPGKTKENILGFYNPIPAFMPEHEHPVLCIVYKRPLLEGNDSVHVEYFADHEEVKLPINP